MLGNAHKKEVIYMSSQECKRALILILLFIRFYYIFSNILTWNLKIKGSSFPRHILLLIREGIGLQSTFIWIQPTYLFFLWSKSTESNRNNLSTWFWMFSLLVFPWNFLKAISPYFFFPCFYSDNHFYATNEVLAILKELFLVQKALKTKGLECSLQLREPFQRSIR